MSNHVSLIQVGLGVMLEKGVLSCKTGWVDAIVTGELAASKVSRVKLRFPFVLQKKSVIFPNRAPIVLPMTGANIRLFPMPAVKLAPI